MRLIDADALRKAMFNYYSCVNEHSVKHNYSGDTLMDYEVADLIDDCIDNAPTIDPESLRPKGEWIMTLYTTTSKRGRVISNAKFACPECGYGNGRKKTNFCPNCGTDMRGDKHD